MCVYNIYIYIYRYINIHIHIYTCIDVCVCILVGERPLLKGDKGQALDPKASRTTASLGVHAARSQSLRICMHIYIYILNEYKFI